MDRPLIMPNGKRVPLDMSCSGWKPPQNSPYFGFMTPGGPAVISLSAIAAVFPAVGKDGVLSGNYGIMLNVPGSPNIPIQAEDGLKLLRRMGWKDASPIE